MPIDATAARAVTPGVAHVRHLNNAGASLMPQPVLDAVIEHTTREAEIGGYEAADEARAVIDGVYDSLAALLNAGADEIAITDSATRAWDMAFYSLAFEPGDRILTAQAEYVSNFLAYLQVAQRTGATVEVVPNDDSGCLSVEALTSMLDERVKLVSITHVPTNGGLVNPVAQVGRALAGSEIVYLVDACQSVGQMPVDVEEIGCDLLAATGRKYLRAPRGTGFLYARRALGDRLVPPFLDVRSAEWVAADRYRIEPGARRFESWESNYATKIGLGVAADYARSWGLDAIEERNRLLARHLRTGLSAIDGVRVLDLGPDPCAIVSFDVRGVDADRLHRVLAEQRINVSVSVKADTLLDMTARGFKTWTRASVHYFNTEHEIDALLDEVERAAAGAQQTAA